MDANCRFSALRRCGSSFPQVRMVCEFFGQTQRPSMAGISFQGQIKCTAGGMNPAQDQPRLGQQGRRPAVAVQGCCRRQPGHRFRRSPQSDEAFAQHLEGLEMRTFPRGLHEHRQGLGVRSARHHFPAQLIPLQGRGSTSLVIRMADDGFHALDLGVTGGQQHRQRNTDDRWSQSRRRSRSGYRAIPRPSGNASRRHISLDVAGRICLPSR